MTTFKGSAATAGTVATIIFTASVNGTIIKTIHCANKSSAETSVTVDWQDSSAAAGWLLANEHILPVNSAHQVLDGPIVLDAGDDIRVRAGDAGAVDVTVAAMEP